MGLVEYGSAEAEVVASSLFHRDTAGSCAGVSLWETPTGITELMPLLAEVAPSAEVDFESVIFISERIILGLWHPQPTEIHLGGFWMEICREVAHPPTKAKSN
jgi:hypothetical protein